jgi:hypothetical protein
VAKVVVNNKLRLPKLPMAGGCQCGAVRYLLNSYPVTFYLCHCSECQKQSASAFGESVSVKPEDLEVAGKLSVFERPASSGIIQCEFCPNCGTRLFHRGDSFCNIKGGSFDDRSWLMPAGHIWTSSKQPCSVIRDDELCYSHQPDSEDELRARWSKMIG